jgi:hypothetical protein
MTVASEADATSAASCPAGSGKTTRVALDTHVHLHPVFDRGRFLDAAVTNAAIAGVVGGASWLLFTEMAGVHACRELADRPPDGWSATRLRDGCTIDLRRRDGVRVLVTAGRQVQVEGGLELLVLGSDAAIPDGITMADGLDRALALGALPVVPWGFGKWWGRRGRLLRELLDGPRGAAVFLGDNGGRAAFWPRPALFDRVEAAGRRVLPGSDPLPFASHVTRAGSYGLLVGMDIEIAAPFPALRAILADPKPALATFGRRATPLAFLRDQIAMQVVKRRPGGSSQSAP